MSEHSTIVTLGILAHDEATTITALLDSLFKQSIFDETVRSKNAYQYHVIIVPNGCSDNTAQIAQDALQRHFVTSSAKFSYQVDALEQGGKSNAWNYLIHQCSPQNTDFYVLIDADIAFNQDNTILNSLQALQNNAEAQVAVDRRIKRFSASQQHSILAKVSSQSSAAFDWATPQISGQFYVARGAALRAVTMPIGLSVEDGFLGAMIITDNFRNVVNWKKIILAPDASHYYDAETSLQSIISHEVRVTIGTVHNCFLGWDYLSYFTAPQGAGAGALIAELNQQTPHWYAGFINNTIRSRGWWVLPRNMTFRRFANLKNLSFLKKIAKFPLACIAFVFDLIVFFKANQKLRSGKSVGYW